MTTDAKTYERVVSVDALRGFTMFWIIGGGAIVMSLAKIFNTPFSDWVQEQLTHVPWDGFHFWDLIMPLFLFVLGVAMPFSFEKRLAVSTRKFRVYCHILFRVSILWILGMIKQGNLLSYNLEELHLYNNTLQAIAAGYFITAIIMLHYAVKLQFVIFVGLIMLYWILLAWVPVPGGHAGELTHTGNMAYYLDQIILGRFQCIYSYTWVLTSISFAATVMMGSFAGQLLKTNLSDYKIFIILLVTGLLCTVAGWLWGLVFPIIKHLWTSSFVIYSGGLCLMLLAVFYGIIDILKWKKWAFGFIVIGANAITAYMVPDTFVNFHGIAYRLVGGLSQYIGDWTEFIRVLVAFLVLWLMLFYMYCNRTFIKI